MHESRTLLPATLLLGMALSAGFAQAAEVVQERIATEHLDLRLERIASGLESPWSVVMLPDDRFLVSERPGHLTLIDEAGDSTRLEGLPDVHSHGQGGLLDLALHPSFGDGEHDWVYFTWSKSDNGSTATALSRARLEGQRLTDMEELFVQDRYSDPGRHYGSRIAWLSDGTLLMSIGDRGTEPPRAQDKGDHAGSVLRLTETGGAADDNPFLDDAEALDELYTIGNRNIQGMVVTMDGEVWASEHGPRGGDEVNFLEAGENYGWPEVSKGRDYGTGEPIGEDSLPGMRDPAHVFDGTQAPSGLAQVTADTFPDWSGNLLAGGLRSERLERLTLENGSVVDSEVILDGHIGRIRDVRQGHDGAIYLLNDDPRGSLYRLVPAD
ncbi:PQQ-dependent sugar dehydrogenase [Billgrantia endophytica]|uniref:Glucose sorbosone dehydrogenase n=1 Tax=Billgrantia endophytica TaxID=2033802 RepID=A0A2N7UBJ0_9GAMM|nr:PQQ-dependent sugar dehydrogenase [Halomonas endophytica]PMR77761.1 glucose sorbosone dehydrogenase [Halomonas endophytica]